MKSSVRFNKFTIFTQGGIVLLDVTNSESHSGRNDFLVNKLVLVKLIGENEKSGSIFDTEENVALTWIISENLVFVAISSNLENPKMFIGSLMKHISLSLDISLFATHLDFLEEFNKVLDFLLLETGECLLSYWFYVLLNNPELQAAQILQNVREMKSLSIVSTTFSLPVRNYMEKNLLFRYNQKSRFSVYSPKRVFYAPKKSNWNLDNFRNKLAIPKKLSNLPSNITHLFFSNDFDERFEGLPPSITQLVFGDRYNHEVSNLNLPSSIEYLQFGFCFNSVIHDLPCNLRCLIFGEMYNRRISSLPPSLLYLTFGRSYTQWFTPFPPNLLHLEMGENYNFPLTNLPSSLTHLTLGKHFVLPISNLPNSLTFLKMGAHFNRLINRGNLPPSLTHLILGDFFNQRIDDLPPSITHLVVGLSFNKRINNLPPKLQHFATRYPR